jgi:DNA-directed RNA polymerase II subunit RPB1
MSPHVVPKVDVFVGNAKNPKRRKVQAGANLKGLERDAIANQEKKGPPASNAAAAADDNDGDEEAIAVAAAVVSAADANDAINKNVSFDSYLSRLQPRQATIDGVQFGIISSDIVKRMSAVNVTLTNISRAGVVCQKGVNDIRMGTTNASLLCSTCGNTQVECPGHTGMIALEEPVLNVEFIGPMLKVLSCVCFFCSRLLLPSDHPKYKSIMTIQNAKRRMGALVSQKIRKCANFKETTPDMRCGSVQPRYVKVDASICPVFEVDEDNADLIREFRPFDLPECSPGKLLQVLTFISDNDIRAMGMDPVQSHPSSMLWQNLLVPPVSIRPPRCIRDSTSEDDLSVRLRLIVRANLVLAKVEGTVQLARYTYGTSRLYCDPVAAVNGSEPGSAGKRSKAYDDLQKQVAGYQDAKYQNKSADGIDYGKDRKSIRHRFAGDAAKKNRVRLTICGKRQNYAGRTVIIPMSSIAVDEVGIPRWFCMRITVEEIVTRLNFHYLKTLVLAGPDVYPGANYVEFNGTVTSLKYAPPGFKLCIGMKVRRHIAKGDIALMNRQPSLHKMSIMAHKVVVISGRAFGLHIAVTPAYNADFDGDEMCMYSVMGPERRAEAQLLMSVESNIMKDGVPIVKFKQNSVAAAYMMTRPGYELDLARAQQIAIQCDSARWDVLQVGQKKTSGQQTVSGTVLFSSCLPSLLCVSEGGLVVKDGILLSGRVKSSNLNGVLLYSVWKDLGSRAAVDFMTGMYKMLGAFIEYEGLSIGVNDCTPDVSEAIQGRVDLGLEYVAGLHCSDDTAATETQQQQQQQQQQQGPEGGQTEDNICTVLDKVRDIVGDAVLSRMRTQVHNGLIDLVDSGAKGSEANLVQIQGMLGQQRNHASQRIVDGHLHMCLPYKKYGMVTSSFMKGLDSLEYISHLVGTRVGLVDGAVKTSDTGYGQRKLAKAMEDISVDARRSVRNEMGMIIQYRYADDGTDQAFVESCSCATLAMTELEVLTTFRCFPSGFGEMDASAGERWLTELGLGLYDWRGEISRLLELRRRVVGGMIRNRDAMLSFPCSVNFKRLAQSVPARLTKLSDLTPYQVRLSAVGTWVTLQKLGLVSGDNAVELLFFEWCSVRRLWDRFDSEGLAIFLGLVLRTFELSAVGPGEPVGLLAAQNCSEPMTQMTLSRFHKSGLHSQLTSGVARMKEIMSAKPRQSTPSMSIFLKPGVDPEEFGVQLIEVHAWSLVLGWDTLVNEERNSVFVKAWSRWEHVKPDVTIVFRLDKVACLRAGAHPRKVACAFSKSHMRQKESLAPRFSFSAVSSDDWWVGINLCRGDSLWKSTGVVGGDDAVLAAIYSKVVLNCVVSGVVGISDFCVSSKFVIEMEGGRPTKVPRTVIVTEGSNLVDVLGLPDVDVRLTTTNSIWQIKNLFGIDAACAAVKDEWKSIISSNSAHVGAAHIPLIADTMGCTGNLLPMTFSGICGDETSVAKKVSFEKAMGSFVHGAYSGKYDNVKSCMDAMVWGTSFNLGIGNVEIVSSADEFVPSDEVKKAVDAEFAARIVPFVGMSDSKVIEFCNPVSAKKNVATRNDPVREPVVPLRFCPSSP